MSDSTPPLTRREARAREAAQPPTSRRHARDGAPTTTTQPGLTRREARAQATDLQTPPTGTPHRETHAPAPDLQSPPPGTTRRGTRAPAPDVQTPPVGNTRRGTRAPATDVQTPPVGTTRRETRGRTGAPGLPVAPREPATPLVGLTRRDARQAPPAPTPGGGLSRREARAGEARGGGDPAGSGRTPSPGLVVDWTACEGRGLCVDLLPEVLESDPWGYPKRRDDAPRPAPGTLAEIPAELAAPAKRAVHLCPRLALRLQPPQ